jgi:uncharacterized protein (DUF3820 family)
MQQLTMPDGPERKAALQQLVKIMVADMPYKFSTHRILTDMTQPWVIGYQRHPFDNGVFWRFVDIDNSARKK